MEVSVDAGDLMDVLATHASSAICGSVRIIDYAISGVVDDDCELAEQAQRTLMSIVAVSGEAACGLINNVGSAANDAIADGLSGAPDIFAGLGDAAANICAIAGEMYDSACRETYNALGELLNFCP